MLAMVLTRAAKAIMRPARNPRMRRREVLEVAFFTEALVMISRVSTGVSMGSFLLWCFGGF